MTQDLYCPTRHPDSKGKLVAGDVGEGFDVLQFRRGEDGYSPVCRVRSFDPLDPMKPEGQEVMRRLVVTFVDADHLEVEGTGWENGAPAKEMCTTMKLVRKK